MAATKLQRQLLEGLRATETADTTAYKEVLKKLRETADVVEHVLSEGAQGDVTVEIVQGQRTNDGLEHRMVVRSQSHGISDFLIRAYVPISGYPVTFDSVDDEDAVYRSAADLDAALVALTHKEWFQDRVIGLREMLRDPTMVSESRVVSEFRPASTVTPSPRTQPPEQPQTRTQPPRRSPGTGAKAVVHGKRKRSPR